jgi:hypothetical protein
MIAPAAGKLAAGDAFSAFPCKSLPTFREALAFQSKRQNLTLIPDWGVRETRLEGRKFE